MGRKGGEGRLSSKPMENMPIGFLGFVFPRWHWNCYNDPMKNADEDRF